MLSGTRLFLIGLLALLSALAGAPTAAAAQGFPAGSVCTALAPPDVNAAALARSTARWDCSGTRWKISGSKASLVRIDMTGQTPPPDSVLTTRLTRFNRLSLTAIGRDGTVSTREITPGDLRFSTTGWKMRMPLPSLKGDVAAYVLKVSGARHEGLLSDVRIAPPPDETSVGNAELVLAALCGMMLMPLVLNFGFYRVLRQPFALWHALVVFAMLVQTFVASGLVNRFASLSIMEISVLSSASLSVASIAASQFIATLVEPGMLNRTQLQLLHAMGPWMAVWTVYYLFAGGPLLPSIAPAYYVAFLPFIATLVWSMATAARRGSRTVWFQIIGWTPLIGMALVRIGSLLGMADAPMSLMTTQHLSLSFEILLSTLGAADRFMAIKHERDRALTQARVLESLAERDPLTGLYNRRGFEERYARLAKTGYDTMAVLDLDHFKSVNDTRGHAVGDAVLRAVALALMPDEDTIAVRLGGEEFLLLMRGADAAERAERRRQSIPARIAAEISGLERPVTASMGLVTGAPPMRFATLYTRCDELLYEAKSQGRNRTVQDTFSFDTVSGAQNTVVNLR
ncbi:diguanylate cyclase [Novosphingobium mangrovi (ex Huang et al. 2023)]|uniref:diguanylate cyclase n=1 Tax=Novosphingobium mangrovi (ex Huang et al. 2023) TaxID=2976432 RepID=A0ABT2I363_9SPHN|nr:diguanylate cyclase [Novosphingobium mangrovi (ex Huang et al. 2023)]MCT2399247.1 GGDEF domain-containing protein [Novosphingobium mangrovi (ex Huang et al. 2023)]